MTLPARSERSGNRPRAVVDTNVWVSGLINPDGPPGQVLRALRNRRFQPVATWALAEELANTLRRPKLARYGFTDEDIEDVLSLLAPFLPTVEVEVLIRDPDDAPVVAAALTGHAEIIVTGDKDLLDDGELRSWLADRRVEVRTPRQFLDDLDA